MKKLLILGFGLLIFLNSCVKKTEVPVGEVKIRFVNAVRNSLAQDVYVNNGKLDVAPVAAGQATAYLSLYSGQNYLAMANTGTSAPNGDIIPYNAVIGSYATFFYVQNLQGAPATGLKEDDMTAPASGKARVRFIHLNGFLNNSLSVSVVGGGQLFPALGFGNASSYYDVDPGVKFQVAATLVVTAPVVDANLKAGKIYTIFFNGTTGTELYGNLLIQN
ncbi:MAG: DUF4397 domain-containing protein [Pedobacter sp.]